MIQRPKRANSVVLITSLLALALPAPALAETLQRGPAKKTASAWPNNTEGWNTGDGSATHTAQTSPAYGGEPTTVNFKWELPATVPDGGAEGKLIVTVTAGSERHGPLMQVRSNMVDCTGIAPSSDAKTYNSGCADGSHAQVGAAVEAHETATVTQKFRLTGPADTVRIVLDQGPEYVDYQYTVVKEACPASGAAGVAQDSCPGLKVSGIKGNVELQRGGAGWEPLKDGDTLREGDRVHTGWKSEVTVTLPKGGTVTIKPMSLIAVDRVDGDGGGRLLLRIGEVKAVVHKIAGAAGDLIVKTPTTTASIRGTKFGVRYYGSKTVVSVTEGRVSVKPSSGRGVDVRAGREVVSTRSKVSRPVAIGRAGAPAGSVGPANATALLTRALAKGFKACRVDVAHTRSSFALQTIDRGWRATLKIVGARRGRAVWTIKGRRVTARKGWLELIAALQREATATTEEDT